MNQYEFVPPLFETEAEMRQAAIDKQVARVFENAALFDSAYPVIQRLAKARGWIFGQGLGGGMWHTKSVKLHDKGILGPKFDTLGELLEWLFEQVEIDHDITPE
jgi:hypothetical protein